MIAETVLGVAIAAAVIGVILLVKALLPRDCPVPGVERVTLLRCTGDAAGLEAALREPWDARARICILDAGMTAEALKRAELLALRYGAELTADTLFFNDTDTGSTDGRERD